MMNVLKKYQSRLFWSLFIALAIHILKNDSLSLQKIFVAAIWNISKFRNCKPFISSQFLNECRKYCTALRRSVGSARVSLSGCLLRWVCTAARSCRLSALCCARLSPPVSFKHFMSRRARSGRTPDWIGEGALTLVAAVELNWTVVGSVLSLCQKICQSRLQK